MSTHGHINKPTGGWSPARPMDWGRRSVLAVTLLAGLFMTAVGAFQLGIGITLLLAPIWHDGLALAWPASSLPAPPMPSTTLSTWTWAAAAAIPGGWPPCCC